MLIVCDYPARVCVPRADLMSAKADSHVPVLSKSPEWRDFFNYLYRKEDPKPVAVLQHGTLVQVLAISGDGNWDWVLWRGPAGDLVGGMAGWLHHAQLDHSNATVMEQEPQSSKNVIDGWVEMHDGKMMGINPRGGPMLELDFHPGYRLIGPKDKLIAATPEFVAALKAVVFGFGNWLNPDDHRDELAVLQAALDGLGTAQPAAGERGA